MLAEATSQCWPTRRQHDFFTLIDIPNQQSSCSHLCNSFYNTPTDGAMRMMSSAYMISSGFWRKEKQSVRLLTYIANRCADSMEPCLTPKSNFKNFKNRDVWRTLPRTGSTVHCCSGHSKINKNFDPPVESKTLQITGLWTASMLTERRRGERTDSRTNTVCCCPYWRTSI